MTYLRIGFYIVCKLVIVANLLLGVCFVIEGNEIRAILSGVIALCLMVSLGKEL
jgi:hypothetical protein